MRNEYYTISNEKAKIDRFSTDHKPSRPAL